MAYGICKLTGVHGKFVKSHIIPNTFTKPEVSGAPLIQFGRDEPPRRRWSGWYDQKLVTEQGETILRDLDTWAIPFLRKSKLVWSGWGPSTSLPGNTLFLADYGFGRRIITVNEPSRLRLFLYSLLWRAAASEMKDFDEVELPIGDLEILRQTVLTGIMPPIDFYPASVAQLSTLGDHQNLTPITSSKAVPAVGTEPGRVVPIIRFYFDGLVIHFHNYARDDGYAASLGPQIVGNEETLIVTNVPYESSFQRENLLVNLAQYLPF